ncbi:glycosyltransferase [uncultured Maribacter sp.]|uniref:glycosyltransferase n=1 Tax=uncultured Maribacter sp. TaxID=431308 RepID=UPI002618E29D|nr:glycosyltransferase [uncultured Maribacter sp.]
MTNICYFVSSLVRTGPTNQLSYIINHLDRNQFNPIIITLFKESNKTIIEYFTRELNIEVICLNTSKIRALISVKKELSNLLKSKKIDIVQTQGILADYISFKQISDDIKRVSTIRNYPLDDYKNIFGKLAGNILANMHINLIRHNARSFIACSRTIHSTFKKKKNINISYIQNGVDIEKFAPSMNKKESKTNVKLPLDKIIFISVGSLIPRKDFTTLIEGFKLFNIKKSAILLIAGEGKEELMLKKISDNQIKFLGNVPNILEYLQASDCFISSSLSEGLPNSVMEAMACGLPCALSEIPSHEELKGNEGLGHVFFKEKNIKGLSDALNEMVCKKDSLSEKSFKIVNEEFSANAMSVKYQNLYIKILKK